MKKMKQIPWEEYFNADSYFPAPVPNIVCPYMEIYRDAFITFLAKDNEELKNIESKNFSFFDSIAQLDRVGNFAGFDTPIKYYAAFGLVLLYRLIEQWEHLNKDDLFYIHEQLFECFQYVSENNLKSTQAKQAANARYVKSRKLRMWVIAEWEKNKEGYTGNKSAFARDYVKRLKNEHDFNITERQLRESWLGSIKDKDML